MRRTDFCKSQISTKILEAAGERKGCSIRDICALVVCRTHRTRRTNAHGTMKQINGIEGELSGRGYVRDRYKPVSSFR